MTTIGNKRCRVQIQEPTDTPDAFGDAMVRTYSVIATVWASIVSIRAQERNQFAEVLGEITHRIFFRYQSAIAGMNHKWRIVEVNGAQRTFDVIANRGPNPKLNEVEVMGKVRDGD